MTGQDHPHSVPGMEDSPLPHVWAWYVFLEYAMMFC